MRKILLLIALSVSTVTVANSFCLDSPSAHALTSSESASRFSKLSKQSELSEFSKLSELSELDTLKRRLVESYITPLQSHPQVVERLRFVAANTDGTDVVIRELQDWVDDNVINTLLAGLGSDGLWSDLDYRSKVRSAWPPSFHLERMQTIARAYCSPSSAYYQRVEVGVKLRAALDGWLREKPICPNWWHNEIGGPRMLGPVLLMIEDELTPQQKASALEYMRNARIGMTGQNRTWLAGNVLMCGLLESDPVLVREARDAIMQEVALAPEGKEGIQPDWSFHQHGPQQQFGNYGLAYVSGIANWGRIFDGTSYAMTRSQIEIVRNLVLRGMSRVVWRGMMDINACGRQLFPNSQQGKALGFGRVLLNMMVLDTACAERYRKLYDSDIALSEPNEEVGYTHFANSDMSLYRSREWMASLKMSSPRVVGAEVVNGENLLSYQMADGALMLYRRGDEFENITPVWDYTAIPGITTNIARDSSVLFGRDSYAEFRGTDPFVGGLAVEESEQLQGLSAMVVRKNGLVCRKSWFFGDGFVACGGSGITSPRVTDRPVRTSVAQCRARGEVRITAVDGRVLVFGPNQRVYLRDSVLLIEHDGVGYYFPDGARVRLWRDVSVGNWRRFAIIYDTTMVGMDLFSISIEHGYEPQGASYRYVLLPDMASVDRRALLRGRLFDFSVSQGVHRLGSGMVCFEAGDVPSAYGRRTLRVSAPALVSIDKQGVATAVDPARGNAPVACEWVR